MSSLALADDGRTPDASFIAAASGWEGIKRTLQAEPVEVGFDKPAFAATGRKRRVLTDHQG